MFLQVCLFLLLTVKCYSYQNSCCYEYNRYKIPQDVMVDVVNNLALKLLAIHNENNDNNIAISPYGAVSVLVALIEGVQGSAATEIHRASGIPSDLSVIRIGLRDIHRHLKSYFIPEEGFLSGLTLSHDNVTLNTEYEEILQFYGFDISSFNNALYPDFTTTETVMSTGEESATTGMTTTESLVEIISTTVPTIPVSTTQEINEKVTGTTTTINTVTEPVTETSETTTLLTTSTEKMSEKEVVNEITSTVMTTTENMLSTDILTTTRSESLFTTIVTEPTTKSLTSTTNADTTTLGDKSTTSVNSEMTTEMSVGNGDSISTSQNTVTTNLPSTTAAPTTTEEESTEISTTISNILHTTEINLFESDSTKSNEFPTELSSVDFTTQMSMITTQSNDFNATTDEEIMSTTNTIDSTTNMIQVNDETTKYSDELKINDSLPRNTRSVVDYIIARYYDDRVITQRPPPYNSESDLYFLINGKYKESNINYMTYDTVLPFHYVPHLDALALRFPLDSSKYYLLLLLPQHPQQLNRLICDLRLNSSLKYIIDNLRYTHVKAIIPSFMLKGYVILTPTFQKMGINRVFEPRQADFSPMTTDKNIYVTNIEQAITVNIRNYVDPATMSNNRYLTRRNPVLFKADHPFLYFVMDSEINVTLMAGKIVNPLNSRIR